MKNISCILRNIQLILQTLYLCETYWFSRESAMQNSTCMVMEGSLLNKYIVQPYWLIFASSLCLTMVSVLSDGKTVWRSRKSILASILDTNKYVFGIHLFINFVQFCVLLGTMVDNEPTWTKYQEFYIRWTNSGALLTLVSGALSSILSDETQIPVRVWRDNASTLLVFSFVPIFCTHVFLLGVIYIPLVLAIGGFWYISTDCLYKIIFKKPSEMTLALMEDDIEDGGRPNKISITFVIQVLAFKLTIICLFISWFQTLFNYGVLLYEKKEQNGLNCYVEIMASEYSMRDTKRYFEAFAQDGSSAFFILTSLF